MEMYVKEYKNFGKYLVLNSKDKEDEELLAKIMGEFVPGASLVVPFEFILKALDSYATN